MSARLCFGATTVALLATVIAASAAQSGSAMKPASDAVALTPTQRHEIYRDVRKQKLTEAAPAGFTAKVGEAVPKSIKLHALPVSATKQVPAVKSDEYAMLQREALIVDPGSRKIADVITH